jgi:hypothetical protein
MNKYIFEVLTAVESSMVVFCGYSHTNSHGVTTLKPTVDKPLHAEIFVEMFSVIQRQHIIITHRKFYVKMGNTGVDEE